MMTTGLLTRLGRVSCVINPLSGSTPANAPDLVREKLSVLQDQPRLHVAEEHNVLEVIQAALADKPDVLIVWGGDGTIACALRQAGPEGPAVLPLPGGTMNLLPLRVLGEDGMQEGILDRALEGGQIRAMPCGEIIGGERFFVAAMIGDLTRLAHSREALREGKILEAAEIVHDGSALALKSNLSWRAPGRRSQTATALTVNINPETPGVLEVATIDPDNLLELARISFDMVRDGWRKAESIQISDASAVEVSLIEARAISLTLDGELMDLPSPLRFRRIDQAAWIFVPAMKS